MHTNVEFPEEDKPILSSVGFDVGACIAAGKLGDVFNGICNSIATKLHPIHANEAQKEPENVVHVKNKPYKEVRLRGKTFAVKTLTRANHTMRTNFLREAKLIQNLNHPNIVETYNVVTLHSQRIYIIMEYMNSGTLTEMLNKRAKDGKKLNEIQTKLIITELTNGLQYLHNQNVVHNDIHTGNIMFTKIQNSGLRLKYVDFGCSKEKSHMDCVRDIMSLGLVFFLIKSFTTFSETAFHTKLENIIKRMRELQTARDMDMNTVTHDIVEPTLLSSYNPFDYIKSDKSKCNVM